jgi:hypothetical protein
MVIRSSQWLSSRDQGWTRRPELVADAHDCIMVRSSKDGPKQGCGAISA